MTNKLPADCLSQSSQSTECKIFVHVKRMEASAAMCHLNLHANTLTTHSKCILTSFYGLNHYSAK